ncbi:DnaT-like ssDNA-binding domain-containing protein [Mycetohabitans sp. B46]|uniref:DnaT-like ssDNA-binding domain-containing protein n=1 Tax=Mycetohabitans sp. B46 TaxID=2772536 RepID=UPI00307E4D0F
MPNRVLREGILTSERVNELSWEAEVFYRRLMSVVDDYGRFTAHPSLLRAALYPLKLDTVRDANMERLLAAVEQARLVRVYEVAGKRYLEMLDFRQQIRAKESKYPQPPAEAQHMHSSCVADDSQMPADEHLDEGVVEDDIPTPLPSARADENSAFRMFVGWKPSPHLSTLAHQSGLPMPDSNAFNAAIGEFIAYWLTQTKARTQHEWDHALVKALQGNRLRGSSQKATPGRRLPKSENFAAIDYGEGGRL